MSSQYYEETIWTNHALKRLEERGLPQSIAYLAFKHPDYSHKAKEGATEFQKKVEDKKVTVIAKQNDRSEWIIVSCWVDPPFPGSKDDLKHKRYLAYQKASFWGKLWMEIQRDVFGIDF